MQQHTVRTKSGEVSAIDFRGVQANFGQVYANAGDAFLGVSSAKATIYIARKL